MLYVRPKGRSRRLDSRSSDHRRGGCRASAPWGRTKDLMGNDDFGWRPPRHRDNRTTFGEIRGLGPPRRGSNRPPPTPRPEAWRKPPVPRNVARAPVSTTRMKATVGGSTPAAGEPDGLRSRPNSEGAGGPPGPPTGAPWPRALDQTATRDVLTDLIKPTWVLSGRPMDLDGRRLVELQLTRPGVADIRVRASSFSEARALLATEITRNRK